MKYRIEQQTAPYLLLACLMLLVVLAPYPLSAQSLAESSTSPVRPPRDEKFVSSTDILVPWRDGTCVAIAIHRRDGSGCFWLKHGVYQSLTTLSVSDLDGKLWLPLSLDPKSPAYFGKSEKIVPFAAPGMRPVPPQMIVLRIAQESEHWYEVIINEDTGERGYVLKSDPEWLRSTFQYWLWGHQVLRRKAAVFQIYDAPNGKICEELENEAVDFIRLDHPGGEWALVRWQSSSTPSEGWVRWRDGRRFLVDCVLDYKTGK